MICGRCFSSNNRVLSTREVDTWYNKIHNTFIGRVRECLDCGFLYRTCELTLPDIVADEDLLQMIKDFRHKFGFHKPPVKRRGVL